jgi:hypothetical protein
VLGIILNEGTASLRGRFVAAQHVFADAALSDVDAQFEQLAMDAGRTPAGILTAHPRIRSRISWEMTGLPGWPHRTLQVQNRRKPTRCQHITVSGLTIASAEGQSRQRWD